MKGPRLIINVLTAIAVSLIMAMISLNIYPSWSQYARSLEEPMFLLAMSCISSLFLIRSLSLPQRYQVIYSRPRIIRLEHLSRYAGFFFMGIIATPVTHPSKIIQVLHFVFTILAILFCYFEILGYYRGERIFLKWAATAAMVIGMVLGFFTDLYTLGVGETIAAMPVMVHVIYTNNR